jgi:thiamine transport system substrate-binding protein
MSFRLLLTLVLSVVWIGTSASTPAAQEERTLTVVTHDSFNVSESVLQQFEEESGITVSILRAGDAGQVVNQAVLSAGNPQGDVLFGVDNTFLSRALNAEIFIPYQSPNLENVHESFIIDESHQVTPIDYGDVCINYDIAYFEENDLEIPESLEALTEPEYEGLLVVQNPATSSPGLAFLLATVAQFGTSEDEDNAYTYLGYWEDLLANDALVTDDWSTAYYTHFTQGGNEGAYPLVVSYASSPPFTYSEELDAATTASIVAPGTCFRQIEFAGILDGAENVEEAQEFIDFMLSLPFQEDVPEQMYVFPVHVDAELPEIFAEYAQIPEQPAALAYEEIEANREIWIDAWTEVALGR